MKKVMLFAIFTVVVFLVGCGDSEKNPLETSERDQGVQIKVQEVKVIPTEKFGESATGVWVYLSIDNPTNEEHILEETNFLFRDMKGSIIHQELEVTLFDPSVVTSPAEALMSYCYGNPPNGPLKVVLGPRDKASIGLFTIASDPVGDWYLVCKWPNVRIPLQAKIEEEIKNEAGKKAGLDQELAAIDLQNINFAEYFPLKAGNSWKYQVSCNGSHESYRKLEVIDPFNASNTAKPTAYNQAEMPSALIFYCSEDRFENEADEDAWWRISQDRFYGVTNDRILSYINDAILVSVDSKMIIGKEIITVPAGTFACIKVEKVPILPDATRDHTTVGCNYQIDWYAKGVGMVKREYDEGGSIIFEEILLKYDLK